MMRICQLILEEDKMEYRIGLDIGIGTIGWAVVSAKDDTHEARIEDFGTRIFDSGENEKSRASNCQGRRGFRGVRRLERRRNHRKELLFSHFQNNGLIDACFFDETADIQNGDVYRLKVRGLEEKLSPAELYKCLVHSCNHRGYRDFYEKDEDDLDDEASVNADAANKLEASFRASGLRTISEYLLAEYCEGEYVKLRNREDGIQPYTLIRRGLMQEEAELILKSQQRFHPALTDEVVRKTIVIIFRQRDFEDGPGDPNDPDRKYFGFLETLGKCTFYRDEVRGFRGTVLADVYAVTNTLSQYRFVNTKTGEYLLTPEIAKELVDTLLTKANLTMTDVKSILKRHGFKLLKGERSDDKALGKAVKFLKLAKTALKDQWESYFTEEQFDPARPSKLHRIGELICKFQTPSRREKEMKAAGIPDELIRAFAGKKISGTSAVSYRYMCDAIHAFLNGEIYGNFQAQTIAAQAEMQTERAMKLAPSCIDDPDMKSNRVVFKAINECRKIVNAIIDRYGSPTDIVIEVASELGKSFDSRTEMMQDQRKREKANDTVRKTIAQIIGVDETEITGDMMDRYRLFHEQGGVCVYSGEPLGALADVIRNGDKQYEVDHIVPFSLILDNSLHNKALVFVDENQAKKQRTPLMYMDTVKAKAFSARVRQMYSRKDGPISKRKLDYYLLADLYSPEARELMDGWKSRNINDTRYITKYIAGILSRYLLFAGNPQKRHVHTVKGAVTQRFRREWLRTLTWGEEQKCRDNYLNHAIDALICANLTPAYIEVGSDAMRLRRIVFESKKTITNAYRDYLESCVKKMQKYYGFREEYTRSLLADPHRIPAYIPELSAEVAIRFGDWSDEEFQNTVDQFYGVNAEFVVKPHKPIPSCKQERKFCGTICDSNPIRLIEINGEQHKLQRTSILSLNSKNVDRVYTADPKLKAQLAAVFEGRTDEKYTVATYLKEQGLGAFVNAGGQVVRRVSLLDPKPTTNYYRVDKQNGNYSNLSGMKYYCVEVYRDTNGKTQTCGVRFVDVAKKGKKLYRKPESLPADYKEHVMYLYKNDYIRICDKKGTLKVEGFYRSVFSINESRFYMQAGCQNGTVAKTIAANDRVEKYDISVLGLKGGKVRCSEPLPFIEEKR